MIEIRTAPRTALDPLLADPSLAPEFDWLSRTGHIDDLAGECRAIWIGGEDGRTDGFAMALVLPSRSGLWSIARIGVVAAFRRRGIGSALLETVARHLAALPAERRPATLHLSAWLPSETAAPFARRHGFRHARTFWAMERPRAKAVAVEWPAGIEIRGFDGGERALADWSDCHNEAFGDNPLTGLSTVEDARAIAAGEHFDPAGLVLAYRDGRCVGFCRNAVHETHGEIDMVGVVPEARGIGLGRALLRWGVGWLEERNAPRAWLMVDGENESALRLYRSEGFEVTRTRHVWGRPVAG